MYYTIYCDFAFSNSNFCMKPFNCLYLSTQKLISSKDTLESWIFKFSGTCLLGGSAKK